MKLYDFGADFKGRKPEALKALAWPVNAWTCYIPDNVNPQLNILEKLILSLVSKRISTTKESIKEILVNQLKLNSDLVENVLEECMQNHFNKNYKEFRLKSDSEKVLAALDGEITPGMEMSDTMKKVYLLQDAVTNVVVPCFNIEQLQSENDYTLVEDKNCVILHPVFFTQPRTAAINNALRLWGRIFKAMNSGETVSPNSFDMDIAPVNDDDDIDGDNGFGQDEAPVKTLADRENVAKRIEAITVFDDEPKTYYAKGYLAFNPSNPSEIEVVSPFGAYFDNWFMKLVNRLRVADKAFSEELEMFLMEKTEQFKDTVAFGNDLDIQLFDDFPVICNDKKYAILRKAIKELSKDVDRIRKGEDESTNFVKNMRTAIEVMFRTVIDANPEIKKIKTAYRGKWSAKSGHNCDFDLYGADLRRLVETYRLNSEIESLYKNTGIYNNMIDSYQGNTKDNAALILIYALKNPGSNAMQLVRNYDYLFVEILKLINLGNDASHGGKKYVEMYYSKDEAEKFYAQFENIVRALYTNLVEGER